MSRLLSNTAEGAANLPPGAAASRDPDAPRFANLGIADFREVSAPGWPLGAAAVEGVVFGGPRHWQALRRSGGSWYGFDPERWGPPRRLEDAEVETVLERLRSERNGELRNLVAIGPATPEAELLRYHERLRFFGLRYDERRRVFAAAAP